MTRYLETTRLWIALGYALAIMVFAAAARAEGFGDPPSGFTSAIAEVNGIRLHYVRGGDGPAVILVHGFPEDWTEYKVIMPRLAKRFDVIAVDLPGIGKSSPAAGGYDAMNLATHIRALIDTLGLKAPYVVGHDLGAIVTYAHVRRYPEALRGAMILDVPVPGIAGWDEAIDDFWHIGFIQVPDLPEALVTGRQEAFIGYNLSEGRFSEEQREYYIDAYGADQLHAAFEIYRAFPKDGEWNEAQRGRNATPLTVVVGEKSYFARFLPTFVDGYRAKGMTGVASATIPDAAHYMLADNPDAVANLIERQAATEQK
jgi:pimeloyl-ACP methyl ester carboxylesterase